jgi:cytochrome c oxidase assembly factor CtaG
VGTVLFLSLHFFLGYVGGVLLSSLRISLPLLAAIVAVLLILGLATWVVIRRQKNPGASAGETVAEAFEAWHEATCPVCLALGAASHFEAHT